VSETADLLGIATAAVAAARDTIRSKASFSVSAKGERDLVTDVDLAVEDQVRSFLARETPHIGFLGEERGRDGGAGGLWWALDPVDGTANFARGIPLCGVSLALVDGARSTVAAISLPFLDVTYTAAEGLGAHAGGEPIRVSAATGVAGAMVSIGDFSVGAGAAEKNAVKLALLADLGARAERIRMLGTAAIDLAWVAQGRLEGTVILANMPWDTMAGVLLVREAGGVVVDADGTDHTTASAATIAVCPGLRADLLAAVERAVSSSGRTR
jgi:myo-inositol-1(or 4)-monophosphatase